MAHAEIGKPSEGSLVARIKINTNLKILDLESNQLPSDILQAVTVSALLSAPTQSEGWEKPEYTFSRFVADCAINAGFNALRYPSIASPLNFNLVVFPSDLDWPNIAKVTEINVFHMPK